MHGAAEVLRVRAREADALDAVDRIARAQQLAELGVDVRQEVAAPGVHVLAEQRQLAHALSARGCVTSARTSPGRRLTSRPRTAGTMQYEHVELQPIEICTHAWKRRSRCIGSVAANLRSSPVPHAPRVDAEAARAEPLAEVRDRARPERDVDVGIEREEPLALRLRVAAADGDDHLGPLALSRRSLTHVRGELRVRLLADRARVEDDDVGLALRRRLAETELLEHALDALGVVGVHLAPERRDVVALHRTKGSDLRSAARYGSSMQADPTESGLSPR